MRTHHLAFGIFPYPRGYAGTRIVQSLLDALNEKGHKTSVLSLRRSLSDDDATVGEVAGTRYQIVESGWRMTPSQYRAWQAGRGFMRRQMDPECINVLVHYGLPDPRSLPYLAAARRMGYRLIHWIVEDYAAYPLRWSGGIRPLVRIMMARMGERLVPRYSDGVVVLTRRLKSKYDRRARSVRLIPISVKAPPLSPSRPPASHQKTIVYAGTFGHKEGLAHLFEGFIAARAEGLNARLSLLGGASQRKVWQEKYASRDDVEFTGYLSDQEFSRRLGQADVLCMTRTADAYSQSGFPYKLGEYLAAGRPVLATRVSDIEDYLVDGESACLVPPGNSSAIADALLRLCGDPAKAQRMAERGHGVFEKHFSSSAHAGAWMDYMEHLFRPSTPQ